jgi:hypothetical protein
VPSANGILLVLFSVQNRTFGPYLAAIDRIAIPVMRLAAVEEPGDSRTQIGLFGMQNRTFGPYLPAIDAIIIPVMRLTAVRRPEPLLLLPPLMDSDVGEPTASDAYSGPGMAGVSAAMAGVAAHTGAQRDKRGAVGLPQARVVPSRAQHVTGAGWHHRVQMSYCPSQVGPSAYYSFSGGGNV